MARARNLKPQFFQDAKLLKCDVWVRLLFAGLWCQADRRGILRDDPEQLAVDIFPRDTFDIEAGLQALTEGGFITRYESQGVRCIRIDNFGKHQNPHKDEKNSDLPEPPEPHTVDTVPTPGQHRANPADSLVLTTDSLNRIEDCGSGAEAPGADKPRPEPKPSRRKTKTPLPDDFALTPAMAGFAAGRGWSDERQSAELERFTAHHAKEATLSADWAASWRTWVLNGVQFDAERKARASPNGRGSPAGSDIDFFARVARGEA